LALTALLRVMVLRGDSHPELVDVLYIARECTRGARRDTAAGAAPGVPRAAAGSPGRALSCPAAATSCPGARLHGAARSSAVAT
jgi:hypothetical protein